MLSDQNLRPGEAGPGSRVRVLLSGPGLIGKKHAQLLSQSAKSLLVGIVAPPSKENLDFAAERDLPLYSSLDEAMAKISFDAAIIASPNEFHMPQALTCIRHGIPVLVEKPLAADLESAALICTEAKRYDVPVLVGHHRTYSSMLTEARNFMQSPKFGELVAMQGSALFRKPEQYFEEGPWRAKIGGGPILINLIHEVGILRFLCGPISAVSASASHRRRGFEVEDTAAITIRFQNGALGTFILSDIAASDRSWELTTGENPAYPQSLDTACYHFAGTNGSLDFPIMKARFYQPNHPPSWWSPFEAHFLKREVADNLGKQLAHFEAVVLHGVRPLVPPEEGYENMRIIDAVRRSIETHAEVEVPH
jgi:predicted dehydrogenase